MAEGVWQLLELKWRVLIEGDEVDRRPCVRNVPTRELSFSSQITLRLSLHDHAILRIFCYMRRQTERQRFAGVTELGRLREYAIDVWRNVAFGDQSLPPPR